jgi:hypothetical protein
MSKANISHIITSSLTDSLLPQLLEDLIGVFDLCMTGSISKEQNRAHHIRSMGAYRRRFSAKVSGDMFTLCNRLFAIVLVHVPDRHLFFLSTYRECGSFDLGSIVV